MNSTEEETAVSGRRNLYVSADDQAVWERAEKLAPESLSALVTDLLRRYVHQREAAKDRIVVAIEDRDGNVSRKAFKGRMLVQDFESEDPTINPGTRYFAAQGANGGIAIWIEDGGVAESFRRYDSFEDATGEDFGQPADGIGWPADLLSAVSAALGEQYAEEIEL